MLGIEPVSGTVRVGPAEALDVSVVDARVRCGAGGRPPTGLRTPVQVRAHRRPGPATAYLKGAELHVELDTPLRGAPGGRTGRGPAGRGDIVLGSATIAAAR